MKINGEKLQEIVSAGQGKGLTIRLRDVSFYVLEKTFDDSELAYKVIFDQNATTETVSAYVKGKLHTFLVDWFKTQSNAQEISDSLTFTENKAALIDMLNEITELAEAGEIAQKDAMKMKADIRIRLQSHFQVQDDDKGTIVIVPPKFNKICPHTQRECYEMTEEYACKRFHLVKDPTYEKKEEV